MDAVNESLLRTRNQLLEEIKSLSDEEFNHKPGRDQWSVAEVCHHLFLLEGSTAKLIQHLLKQPEAKKVEPKPIHLATDRSKKFNAPKIVQPSGEPFKVQQMIEMLNDARSRLLETIDKIENKTVLTEKSAYHPAFGDLPLDQWIELIYLHEQRHIEQIKEIKR